MDAAFLIMSGGRCGFIWHKAVAFVYRNQKKMNGNEAFLKSLCIIVGHSGLNFFELIFQIRVLLSFICK